jgi:hypothetical protein
LFFSEKSNHNNNTVGTVAPCSTVSNAVCTSAPAAATAAIATTVAAIAANGGI